MNVLDRGFVELIDHLGNDNTIVSAARVSYLGKSKGQEKDKELIEYLMVNKHTSPFEQVEFQFLVKCPIFVARQWMRHRTWSYNEVSRRYTSDDIDYYLPEELYYQSESNKQASSTPLPKELSKRLINGIKVQSEGALRAYELLLNNGISREHARMVLPLNLYTSFYAKTDLHNLFHFLELRRSSHAQKEIRLYAMAIEKLIEPIVPVSFNLWKENL